MIQNNFRLARMVLMLVPLLGCAGDGIVIADGEQAAVSKRVLRVGPGQKYSKPSVAARSARNGDVIEIAAGVYERDAAAWTQNNLTIRGVGGRAHLRANGANIEGKGIWVIKGNNTTVENIEFSGASVGDHNGAGIRQEGAGLTVRNCFFHDNENGILTGRNEGSEILIEHSEFARNGHGDGQTHNLYVGHIKRFTLRYSYVHHAIIGHNVKTRARENYILYNRIMDEESGNSSYAIDFSNGGIAYVIGNLVQQGPNTDNSTLVSFGAEGLKNPANELYLVNNTLVNDYPKGGIFIFAKPGAASVKVINNLFVGQAKLLEGSGELERNIATDGTDLRDRARLDYRLKAQSRAIDSGMNPGSANGFNLAPRFEYVHKAERRPRNESGAIDVGAYEYQAGP
jgi:hypothetical protein